MGRTVKIFDTTLRDGEQSPGCSMNLNEKIEVAKQLEALKVDIIEAGFAAASPGDAAAIAAIADTVRGATICSLARCREQDIEAAWNSIRRAESARIHTFLATSPVHMEYKLKMTPDEVLESVAHNVAFAKKFCSDIEFSAEDATRSDLDFLCRVVETAIKAGATTINIPDTVGYMIPQEYASRIKYLREHTEGIENVILSCHMHNDLGMAVANSLAGVEAGIDQNARRVNVTVPDGLRKARITLIAAGEGGRMAARTVYLRGTFSVETENDLWRTVEEKLLAPGCNYYSMEFKKIARKMHVLEIDLTNPAIEVTTAYADDIVPNPNGNKNGNNGFNLRETLSQLCARKTAEGEDVIAGINTGFFDSNDGFTRGAHIEDGELVYMNNPAVVAKLGNHVWAFTIFKDNTASCGKKVFSGKVKIADKEYKFYSVNDTLVRGNNASQLASYPINLYTSRYVKIPHKERQDIVNKLSTRALYVTAKYSADNMTVNGGWFAATVTTWWRSG